MIPVTVNATFCAAVVDEFIRRGVSAAFVAPGSRSTPMAMAVTERPELAVHVMHDERSASFAALGHGLATRTPALVICTSGTAASHFHAAVQEADLSCVPMIVCSADRPPELWGVGAPQTVEQTELYGSAVRLFRQSDPPEDTYPAGWRKLAAKCFAAAADPNRPGPVQLNLSFRDPLAGRPGELPPVVINPPPPWPEIPQEELEAQQVADVLQAITAARDSGVIIHGRGQSDAASVLALGEELGWPVLSDHRAGSRVEQRAVGFADQLLRVPGFGDRHRPHLIIRFGEPHASKELGLWIQRCVSNGTVMINACPWGRTLDPELVNALQVCEAGLVEAILEQLPAGDPAGKSADRWLEADRAAGLAIANELDSIDGLSEPAVARLAIKAVPAGGALVVSSSMPVRDVEWFGEAAADIAVYSNRGANGIDGVTSTAVGIALTGTPTTCLIGDVAFLHDSNALIGLKNRKIDLTILVVNNDGGGIFGFLPQHDLLGEDRYEQLFGTPHGTDFAALAAAHGLPVRHVDGDGLGERGAGVRIVLANTDRTENLEHHARLTAAVTAAVEAAPSAWPPQPRNSA